MLLFLFFAVALTANAETYHGNTNTHVFHNSSCRYYDCANCTAAFATAEEAIAHGYRPCGICRPAASAMNEEKKTETGYVGNTRSHKFHRMSCRYADCANCTVKFAKREDAIKAGYSPGGCCRP